MSSQRILVVEDDPRLCRMISDHLQGLGFGVLVAHDGPKALRIVEEDSPDLILLDITLPTLDGLEVCRAVRSFSSTPIILVTGRDAPEMKITALDIGGDDYLTKPFHADELTARIRAVLRRATRIVPSDRIRFGDLTIDTVSKQVTRGDELVHLTKLEYGLLSELACSADAVVTYERLLRAVWGASADDIRPIHVHICNLRRKIERVPGGHRYILAVPGVGYKFRTPLQAEG